MTVGVATRGWIKAVAVVALVVAGVAIPQGVPTRVAHAADTIVEVDGTCSLAQAIRDVNSGGISTECANHDVNANVIRITASAGPVPMLGLSELAPGAGVDLAAAPATLTGGARTALPDILVPMTIEGDGDPRVGIYAAPPQVTICVNVVNGVPLACDVDRSQPRGARLLHVASTGSLTLRDITLDGGDITGVQGSMACVATIFHFGCSAVPGTDVFGGSIYAEGALTLDHVTIANAVARGGDGARGRWWSSQVSKYQNVLANGGTAWGGAVYAAGPFSASRVLFRNDRVIGGTEGGSARGGAIAFPDGSTTDATISDTIFDGVTASGGNGSGGANGANGARGSRGADGTCSSKNWAAADGGNGVKGATGGAGQDGGAGGNAIGVIAGGRRVRVDHSAVLGAVAQAGTAGRGGIGGIGGDGGDGGNGIGCSGTGPYIGLVSWSGIGGDGGLAGDNGRIGSPGSRGTAVATFDVALQLDLVDVTIAGAVANVPDDVYPTGMTAQQWETARSHALATVAHHGTGGGGAGGPGATPTSNGTPDTTLAGREQSSPVGLAVGFQSSPTTLAKVSYSTIADTQANIPATTGHRASATPRALSLATGAVRLPNRVAGLRGNVIWGSQNLTCPNLGTNGKNVDDKTCVPFGVDNSDRVANGRPIDSQLSWVGAVVRPGISIDDPGVRMPVLGLPVDSIARDLGTFETTSVCALVDGATITDDARRGARDRNCDSGAYEFAPSTGLYVGGSRTVQIGLPGHAYAMVETNPGPSTLLVKVAGLSDEVAFPAGFTPTPNNSQVLYSEATMELTGGEQYPLVIPFDLPAGAGSASSVDFEADLTGAAGGPLTASFSAPIVDETLLRIGVVAPQRWTPCSGWMAITYVATVDGYTSVPAADVRLLPMLVESNRINHPTLVQPGAGTTADDFGGVVVWHLPAMSPGDGTRTITIYLAVGRVDTHSQNVVYPIGSSVQLGASVSFPSQPNHPVAADSFPTVYIGDDVDLLQPGASATLKRFPSGTTAWEADASTPNTVWLTGQLPSCESPAIDQQLLRVSADMNVFDLDQPGSPSILPGGTPVPITAQLFDTTTGWSSLPGSFVPPMSPGEHQLLFEFTSRNGTGEHSSKVLDYTVLPASVTVNDALETGEADGQRTFTVDLSHALTVPVDVDWSTAPATADTSDFTNAQGTVVFQPGETSHTFTVDVVDDHLVEPTEAFVVNLTKGTGFTDSALLTLLQPQGEAQIVDDDSLVVDGSTTVQATEGNPPPATSTVTVPITLDSPAPAGGLLVDWTTVDGTATAPADYTAASGTLTIPEGATSASVDVEVVNDTVHEDTESFGVHLSNLRSATSQQAPALAAATAGPLQLGTDAVVNVVDDDPAPVDSTDASTSSTTSTTSTTTTTTVASGGGSGTTTTTAPAAGSEAPGTATTTTAPVTGTATSTTVVGQLPGALPATGQDLSGELPAAAVVVLSGFALTRVRRRRRAV